MQWSNRADGPFTEIDLGLCNNSQNSYRGVELCLGSAFAPFPLNAGSPRYVKIFLSNGSVREIKLSTRAKKGVQWTELVPVTQGANIPKLMARYVVPGSYSSDKIFEFKSDIERCGEHKSYRERSTVWVDTDKKGAIEHSNRYQGTFSLHYLAVAQSQSPVLKAHLRSSSNTVAFKLKDSNGEFSQFYQYKFDPVVVINNSVKPFSNAEVECRKLGQNRICLPRVKEHWFTVKKVSFGSRQNALEHAINVSYNASSYLAESCKRQSVECSPFVFEVPAAWEEVYSQIEYSDGKVAEVIRHSLRR